MDGRTQILTGRELRYAVAVVLHLAKRTMTLAEMADTLATWDIHTVGDAGLARSTYRWMLAKVRAAPMPRPTVFCETDPVTPGFHAAEPTAAEQCSANAERVTGQPRDAFAEHCRDVYGPDSWLARFAAQRTLSR